MGNYVILCMITIPPYLKKGDTIGIVCPSGFMPAENAHTCIKTLESCGFKVRVGSTLGSQSNYFSGSDKQRTQDLQKMLNDGGIKAILCGRGGYGLYRIIDKLDFQKFKRSPKWIIGFSDITVLQAHIFQHYQIATLHAPMAAAFNDDGYKNQYIASLKNAMSGAVANYGCAAHALNKIGSGEGELIGGNLSLIAHLVGTHSSYKTRHKILFLEDVGEYLYNIDRLFIQLKRAGMLNNLAALVIGGFTDNKDTERPIGKTAYELIREQLLNYSYPICFNFPVSHAVENYALKIGGAYQLNITTKKVSLGET